MFKKVLSVVLALIASVFIISIFSSPEPAAALLVAGVVCLVAFYLAKFIARKTPGLLFQTVCATLALVAIGWTGFVINLATHHIDQGHSINVWVVILWLAAGWAPLSILLLIRRSRVTSASLDSHGGRHVTTRA